MRGNLKKKKKELRPGQHKIVQYLINHYSDHLFLSFHLIFTFVLKQKFLLHPVWLTMFLLLNFSYFVSSMNPFIYGHSVKLKEDINITLLFLSLSRTTLFIIAICIK